MWHIPIIFYRFLFFLKIVSISIFFFFFLFFLVLLNAIKLSVSFSSFDLRHLFFCYLFCDINIRFGFFLVLFTYHQYICSSIFSCETIRYPTCHQWILFMQVLNERLIYWLKSLRLFILIIRTSNRGDNRLISVITLARKETIRNILYLALIEITWIH